MLHLLPSLSRRPGCGLHAFTTLRRCFHSNKVNLQAAAAAAASVDAAEPRESMAFDVLIVGGGPAGLAASIRLKQKCLEHGKDLSVCLIEKGSEIGSHVLSGNVFDPKAMHALFPDKANRNDESTYWIHELEATTGSMATPVKQDQFLVLTESSSFTIPHVFLPPQLHNEGNFVVSLSQVCRWLATQAEELGVEIYPGFAASEVLIHETTTGACKGIATRDVGLAKDGTPKPTFERGVELHARQTLFAEGARGSCSEYLMEHYKLRQQDCQPQTYGLGLKEVWQIPTERHQPGLVQHTLGWPLQHGITDKVFGGSFLYHQEPDLVLVGMVVGLDYANPYLNPYQEFQRWKTHRAVRQHLEGGTCIQYGARVLNEGGYHAIPKLTFPGGALIGCSAGFLNQVQIKGSHTALQSGIYAAEAAYEALTADHGSVVTPVAETGELPTEETPQELTAYTQQMQDSWVYKELYQVRNCHEAFARWGVGGGLVYSGLATHITKGREPWTLAHSGVDSAKTEPAAQHKPITYPPPDNKLTFDLLTNLQRSGTYHAEDQPIHLRIKPQVADTPEHVSWPTFAAPETRFCPAAVYEYVDNKDAETANKIPKKLVINSQNCVHCKCCSIKMPNDYINWTVPEGGGGPQYQVM